MGVQPYGFTEGWLLVEECSDEFDVLPDMTSTGRYQYRVQHGTAGSSYNSNQLAANVSIDGNSNLRVDLKKEYSFPNEGASYVNPDDEPVPRNYTGGGILMREAHAAANMPQYFYAESRIKLCSAIGWHDSFWFSITPIVENYHIGEIDAIEYFLWDSTTQYSSGLHYENIHGAGDQGSGQPYNPYGIGNLYDDWHVYAVDHRATGVAMDGYASFYFDGELHHQEYYPAQNYTRRLKPQMSNISPYSWEPPVDADLPNFTLFDYCRIFVPASTKKIFILPRARQGLVRTTLPQVDQLLRHEKARGLTTALDTTNVKAAQMLAPAVSLAHQLNVGRRIGSAGAPVTMTDTYQTLVTTLPGGAPLSFWRCQSVSAAAGGFVDVRPTPNHGTFVTVAPAVAPTVVGGLPTGSSGALSFTGSYVTVPHHTNYVSANAAVMTWIKDTGSSGATNYIWNKDSPSPANADVWLEYDAGEDFLTLNCRQGVGPGTYYTLDTPFSLSVKNCVIVNLGSGGAELWVNGQQRGVIPEFNQGLITTQPLWFMAAQSTPTAGTIAQLDECAIWNRVLTTAEIIALSQRTSAPTFTATMSGTIDEGDAITFDVRANSNWAGKPADATVTVSSNDVTYVSAPVGTPLALTNGSVTVNAATGVVTFTAGTVTADTVQTFYVRVTDLVGSGDATVTVTIRDIPTVTTYYDDMFNIGNAVALYRMNSTGGVPRTITDSSGAARNGSWNTAVALSTTDLPCAGTTGSLVLNGTQRGSVTNVTGLNTLNATIVGFFKVPNTSREQIIWGRDLDGNLEGDINFRVQAGPTIVTAHQRTPVVNQPGHRNLNIDGIALNRWYHVAQTVSADGYELWLDGRLWGSTVGDTPVSTSPGGAPTGTNIISGFTLNTEPIMWGWLPWAAATGEDAICSLGPWAQYSKVLTPVQIISLCPHVGLPRLTATARTMTEGTTITIPLDDLDPQYVGKRVHTSSEGGIDLVIVNVPSSGLVASQLGNRDILVVSTLGQTGVKSFTVKLQDKKGESNVVTVSVTVQAIAPVGDDLNDAYGLVAANTVGNVIFALRLNDASKASGAPAFDASGNNHPGKYAGTDAGSNIAGIVYSSEKNAYRTNGSTYVTLLSSTAVSPAVGAFSCWFQVTSLTATTGIAHKGTDLATNFQLEVMGTPAADVGRIRLTWRGGVIQTSPGYVETGVRNHVFVAWDGADVRLYVDGMLIGGRNQGSGLTGNTDIWRFGITSGGGVTNCTLQEIMLFGGTTKKTFAHATALAEGQRGLAYRAALPGLTKNVNTTADFNTELAAAVPGTHIVVAAGTAINNPRAFDRNGTNKNQIVIRAGGANCQINGPVTISGSWQVIDGFTFDQGNDPINLAGNRNRITGCTRTRFTQDCLRVNNGRFHRIDHCSFTRPSLAPATGGGCAPIEVNPHLNPPTKFCLIDHMYISSLDQVAGENGRDGIRIGSGPTHTAFRSYTTIFRCLLEDYQIDEIISGKSSDIFVWYTTFTNADTRDYAQNRHGRRGEWRSCYFLNTELRFLGADHIAIGCTFNSNLVRFTSGHITQQEWEDWVGPNRPTRPNCENVGLLQCTFNNGAQVNSLDGGPLKAKDCYMRGNTGEIINLNTAFYTPLPLNDGASQGEWYETATQLGTGAVGPASFVAGQAFRLVPVGMN